MALTDVACKNAKPKLKYYKLADSGGLCLRVLPSGGKYWVLRYRFLGKSKELSLGTYPTVSIVEARSQRDEAKKILKKGIDPSVVKISKRLSADIEAGATFETVAAEWIKKKEKELVPRYALQISTRLKADIFPDLGRLPINAITAPQLLKVLKKVQDRGAVETSHRLKQYCSMVFRYGIACGLLERNPAVDLKDALVVAKSKNFASIEPDDLPDLLKSLSDPKSGMGVQTRLAMRFLMLTFVRTTEMTEATWDEINLENKIWVIAPERMKMRRPHIVPLSRQACDILKVMRQLSSGKYVFTSHTKDKNKPISNMTILKGLERMGYKGRMTGHGFRSLAMTTLREVLNFSYDVIDLQLAHAPKSKIKAAYDRAKFIKERTIMMQAWADYIDQIEPKSDKAL